MRSPVEVSASTVLEFAQQQGAQMFDLRFSDLHGLWHHISYPIGKLTVDSFRDGFGMDGSSIRGWAAIHESDMLLIPDPSTYRDGPVHGGSDAGDDRRCDRSGDAAAL